MNLTSIYTEIESRLKGANSFKLITWYNRQDVEGIVHTVPAVLIEFPQPVRTQNLSGQYQQGLLMVRLHLISKVISRTDGSVKTSAMLEHDRLAAVLYESVHEYGVMGDELKQTTALDRVAYELDMNVPGFAITRQDFECVAYQPSLAVLSKVPRPPLKATAQ
jgi:hypothetical protein